MTTDAQVPTSGSGVSASQFAIELNGALANIAIDFKGATEPTAANTGLSSIAGLRWHDTANSKIKRRNDADNAWMVEADVDQTNGLIFFSPARVRATTGTSEAIGLADRGALVTFNNASPVAVTIPRANTAGFTVGFFTMVRNIGAGLATITPATSTIDGAATLVLRQGESGFIDSDSTNYHTVGCAAGLYFRQRTITGTSPVQVVNGDGVSGNPTISVASRELLSAARTYYVRTDGSDSNTGLVNSSGGAFLTIQKAVNVASALDNGGNDVTIQIADGTYTGAVVLKSFVGGGKLIVQGNSSTPANVVVTTTSGNTIEGQNFSGTYLLKDFKITSTAGVGLIVGGGAVEFSGLNFGTCGLYHIYADIRGFIKAVGNYAVSGNAIVHCVAGTGIAGIGLFTVTFSNSPAFTYTYYSFTNGSIYAQSATFTNGGTVTGQRYNISGNAVIFTGGGGASYLPGNSAGATATGGQYL